MTGDWGKTSKQHACPPRLSVLYSSHLDARALGPITVEPLINGHIWDEHFVRCSEVVPSSEVEMCGQYIGRGRTACPLWSTLQSVQYNTSTVYRSDSFVAWFGGVCVIVYHTYSMLLFPCIFCCMVREVELYMALPF